jgi:ketosteroid isomerase-like protein
MADNSIEARLQRFEDTEEIRRLRQKFHRYVNDGEQGRLASLYTDDALVDFGPDLVAKGRAEIDALFAKLAGNTSFIKQFSANHIVDVDGDTGSGNAYVDARYAASGKSIIACASYDDKYRRTPDGWKFSEMIVHIHFTVPIQEGWGNIVERKHA